MITDNTIYKAVIDYAKANGLKYAYTNSNMEIDPSFDFNGFDFIDTETFEIPNCFEVDDAVIVCLMTPNELTPEDTGKSYDDYYNILTGLNNIAKPQYIAPDGCYVKLMCWCKWGDTGVIGTDGVEDTKIEDTSKDTAFFKACKEAIDFVKSENWYNDNPLDFRVWVEGADNPNPEDDPTPEIFGINEIEKMYAYIKDKSQWDCEIYCTSADKQYAFSADHGVWTTNKGIQAY